MGRGGRRGSGQGHVSVWGWCPRTGLLTGPTVCSLPWGVMALGSGWQWPLAVLAPALELADTGCALAAALAQGGKRAGLPGPGLVAPASCPAGWPHLPQSCLAAIWGGSQKLHWQASGLLLLQPSSNAGVKAGCRVLGGPP